ncbi:MAG: hypothetical protein AVDCRST_MAG89-713 [uncultured Gemmatimonadetes bacterium]|uniref:Uncharacterized protein n=1 Tax=uncultured Gemmatimonadota bacterium TaxID=203437 RepID=A0A6J4KFQ4_9BACT|nr:MAG: hypothetical protein AVDCRST_MAG89-713 [uncultured Gemmatimonadota bacterium]
MALKLKDLFRGPTRSQPKGPLGVAVNIKSHNIPSAERSGRLMPGLLWWGLLVGVVF